MSHVPPDMTNPFSIQICPFKILHAKFHFSPLTFKVRSYMMSTFKASMPVSNGENKMGKIVAIANQKGGVGKTTATLDVYSALVLLKKRVCLIDLDPQTTLSQRIFKSTEDNDSIPSSVKRKAGDANVFALFDEEFIGVPHPINEYAAIFGATPAISVNNVCPDEEVGFFQNNLRSIAESFDYVLIDCPPMVGNIQYCALAASDYVLIPSKLEQGSKEGIKRLLNAISITRKHKNPDLKIAGIFLNIVKAQPTQLQAQVRADIRSEYGELVFKSEVRETTKVTEAEYLNESIITYDPEKAKHIGVTDLIDEILNVVEVK